MIKQTIKTKNNSKIFFIAIAAVLVIAVVFSLFVVNDAKAANASGTPVDYNTYTASDDLIGFGNTGIRDYKSAQEGATIGIVTYNVPHTTSYEIKAFNISGNDPIVGIVPIELFTNVTPTGGVFHVGNEYGFYVKTWADGSRKVSEVMVFDLTIGYGLVDLRPTAFVADIEVLFQRRYSYFPRSLTEYELILADDTARSVEVNHSYPSSMSGAVVAYPDFKKDWYDNKSFYICSYSFNDLNKYFLKDIAFNLTVQNEQSANESNGALYDEEEEEDYGMFITETSYEFDAIPAATFSGGQPDPSSMLASGFEVVYGACSLFYNIGTELGCAAIPGLGIVTSGISLAFSIEDLIDNIAEYKSGLAPATFALDTENPSTHTLFTTVGLKNTRQTQIDEYGCLVKTAGMMANVDAQGRRLYAGTGNFVRGNFDLSHTDHPSPDFNLEYTRAIPEIKLTLVDGSNNVVGGVENKNFMFSRDIGVPSYRGVQMKDAVTTSDIEALDNLYLLPNGKNYFKFTPLRTGNYDFKIYDDTELSVKVIDGNNQQVLDGNDNVFSHKFTQNSSGTKSYLIEVWGNETLISPKFGISCAAIDTHEILLAGEILMSKHFAGETGVKNLDTGNPQVEILGIYLLDSNLNLTQSSYISYSAAQCIDAAFVANKNYYIVLKNNASTSQSCNFEISGLETVSTTTATEDFEVPNQNGNHKFFKFIVPSGQDGLYKFTFDGADEALNFISVKGTGTSVTQVNGFSFPNEYLATLPVGTFYIGVKTTTDDAFVCEVSAEKISPYMYFEITKGNSTSTVEREGIVELERGNEYTVQFRISEDHYAPSIFCDPTTLSSYSSNNSWNTAQKKLVLADTCAITGNGPNTEKITLFALASADFGFFVKVKVVPKSTERITFSGVDYANKVVVGMANGYKGAALKRIYYTMNGSGEQSMAVNGADSAFSSSNFLASLVSANASATDAQFRIVAVGLQTQTSAEERISIAPITQTINCRYSRTTTQKILWTTYTNYHMANALHLYNLRHYSYGRIKMDNDINLGASYPNWTPIPILDSSFNGGGYKIVGLKIRITEANPAIKNYGFVGHNIGSIVSTVFENISITTPGNSAAYGVHNQPVIYVGGVAGINGNGSDTALISSCSVDGEISIHRANSVIGGLTGVNNSSGIYYSQFGKDGAQSKIAGNGDIGGIAGQNLIRGSGNTITRGDVYDSNVTNASIEHYSVQTTRSTGGIVGYCPGGEIRSCEISNSTVKITNTSNISGLQPRMGLIVGDVSDGNIRSVAATNCVWSKGALDSNTGRYCFNGPSGWPYYGLMINTTVDGSSGHSGP